MTNAIAEQPKTKGRKPAPKATVNDALYDDEMGDLVRQYAPECLPPKPDRRRRRPAKSPFVAYWSDPGEPAGRRAYKGWEPVKDEDGTQVSYNDHLLWRTNRDNYEARVMDPPARRSFRSVKRALKGLGPDGQKLPHTFEVDDRGERIDPRYDDDEIEGD